LVCDHIAKLIRGKQIINPDRFFVKVCRGSFVLSDKLEIGYSFWSKIIYLNLVLAVSF